MFKRLKISIKILIVIIVMSLGALLVVFGASYYVMNSMVDEFSKTNITLGVNSSDKAKESLLAQAEDYLLQLVIKQSEAANAELYSINRIVTEAAGYVSNVYAQSDYFVGRDIPRPDETKEGVACAKYFLAKGVEETPEVMKEVKNLSNCEYVFSEFLEFKPILNNVYVGTESGISYRYSRSSLFDENYDPRKRYWYTGAMENQDTLMWFPTYVDSYGNTCITAALSYRDENGETVGVVASDVLIGSFIDHIMELKIGETGSSFMIDSDYNFIAHPDMEKPDFDYDLTHHFEDDEFINEINEQENGIIETVYEGKNCYVAFSKLQENGWIYCACIETDEVTAPAQNARIESDELTEKSQMQMQNKLSVIFKFFIIYFVVIGIIVIMMSFVVSGTITRPIQELSLNVQHIGKGDFDKKIPVVSRDEVGDLALKFNEMQDNLKEYMENIKKVTAENEKIGAELNIAKMIQTDMLPRLIPPYSDRDEFIIAASMDPAKEVGGDFYDFFFVDENHLALTVADVSGKGVPAALFMVIAKVLIKYRAIGGGSPKEVLTEVNQQLCDGNEADLFVTVWFAIIDIRTGKGVASNAGHEHPIVRHENGQFEMIKYKHCSAVAMFEKAEYTEHEFELLPGDTIIEYTDGVTEATNANDEMFGNDRLLASLNRNPGADPGELLENLRRDIDNFVGEAPQFDDITMLGLKFFGK